MGGGSGVKRIFSETLGKDQWTKEEEEMKKEGRGRQEKWENGNWEGEKEQGILFPPLLGFL